APADRGARADDRRRSRHHSGAKEAPHRSRPLPPRRIAPFPFRPAPSSAHSMISRPYLRSLSHFATLACAACGAKPPPTWVERETHQSHAAAAPSTIDPARIDDMDERTVL